MKWTLSRFFSAPLLRVNSPIVSVPKSYGSIRLLWQFTILLFINHYEKIPFIFLLIKRTKNITWINNRTLKKYKIVYNLHLGLIYLTNSASTNQSSKKTTQITQSKLAAHYFKNSSPELSKTVRYKCARERTSVFGNVNRDLMEWVLRGGGLSPRSPITDGAAKGSEVGNRGEWRRVNSVRLQLQLLVLFVVVVFREWHLPRGGIRGGLISGRSVTQSKWNQPLWG